MFGYIKNVVFLAIVQGFEKKYEIFLIHYLRVLKLTKKCTKKTSFLWFLLKAFELNIE
jgi:hypothetical protein